MKEPIAIYLHDHLAGATCAIDLVERIHKDYAEQDVGRFASSLKLEIAADKEILHKLASQFGPTSDLVKDSVAWLAEKASRLKLAHDETGLGLFEALEFLALGIHGKASLWLSLSEVAGRYPGFQGTDFAALKTRAEEQHQAVEKYRLDAARKTFVGSPLADSDEPKS